MSLRTSMWIAAGSVMLVACGSGPGPMARAAPASPTLAATDWRKQLEFIVGSWNFEGTRGNEPLVFHEVCEWIADGYYVQCAVGGTADGFSMLGYQADAGVYVHYNVDGDGKIETVTGKPEGGVWKWGGERQKDGKRWQDRVTMEVKSRDEFTFLFEIAVDGAPWTTRLAGTYRRGPAPKAATK